MIGLSKQPYMKQKMTLTVLRLLRQFPEMRDNDQLLIATIWAEEMEQQGLPTHLPIAHFFKMLSQNKLTSSETIVRVRRRIQEDFDFLRGEKYAKRQANQEKVKKDLGYGQ
jgi:hypothetical protein